MKKALFYLLYVLSAAIPLYLYLSGFAAGVDSYSVSMVFGVFAFILICNQFILAAKPVFIVEALGPKGLVAFHGTVPVLILVFAAVHSNLKELNGYGDSFQTIFGSVALLTIVIITLFTVLFMANTIWMKIIPLKNLKAWVYKTTGLTYKGARVLHNITVLSGIVVLIHVLLASTSDFSSNTFGAAWMALWMTASLVLYLMYRLKGRTLKGK